MYYDGTKLLSMKDINGETPELYLCTSNRTAGKTTYFSRLLMNRFFDKGEKFALLYRFGYELDDCANKFFKDISSLFFNDRVMIGTNKASGTFVELSIDGAVCGYAMALNLADNIKKYSHLFSDVQRIMFDEFQSETSHYCTKEIEKFQSVHTSIARGQGKQVRYVPVYMLSNTVSIINPYYVALGISNRLRNDTKFLRGDGFVLEQGYNETASQSMMSSAFNRAFANSNSKYLQYATQNVYLNDNSAFVERPQGKSTYICTLRYNGSDYSVKEYRDAGIVYCDNKSDETFPLKITVTTEDHQINYVMLKRNDGLISTLRFFFEKGAFRFKDLQCKEAILSALSY